MLPFDFGQYRVLRLLGRGGMGAVYEAEQAGTGRRVALKVLGQTLDSAEMRKRFIREGRLAASVSHPNSVYIYGTEEIDGVPVIAMELVAGGTLRDLLKKKSPLPVREAVDSILQVISGLESAQVGGVLHRDVKPANCFVTPEGCVKVGDFGLSVSTLARADSQLTASGVMLGTPSYAPPEQLRGDELDVRADIYSVGATLYSLLTGKAPFDGENAVQVVAAVLDQTPLPISRLRGDVPATLTQVIGRCLSKKREDRYATYAELREALLPFSAETPEPAPLGLRFVASLVDEGCSVLPWLAYLLVVGRDVATQWLSTRSARLWCFMMLYLLGRMAYYTITEGLWGAGLGKALCGLRVVRPGHGAPGLGRAAARILVFMSAEFIAYFGQVLLTSAAEYSARLKDEQWMFSDWAWFLFVLLFVTMRPSNGWAAVHDLATGTRVVLRSRSRGRQRLESPAVPSEIKGSERLGPFFLLDSLSISGWIAGYDELLRRHVWIRRSSSEEPPLSDVRRDLSRATRLRWLAGSRDVSGGWDAYQAPSGQSLSRLAANSQQWSAVRYWLADLTGEIDEAANDGTLPERVTLDHVWITSEGRAVLLDEPVTSSSSPEKEYEVAGAAGLQQFLHAVAERVLDVSVLPLRARDFLTRLRASSFDRISFVAGNLHSLIAKPAVLTKRRRLASLILAPGICLIICGVMSTLTLRAWNDSDIKFRRANPEQSQLPDAVRLYAECKGKEVSWMETLGPSGVGKGELGDAVGKWTAYRFGDFIRDAKFDEAARDLKESERRMARKIVKDFDRVTPEEFTEADKVVGPAVTAMGEYTRVAILAMGPGAFAVFLVVIGIVNILAVAIFGTSLGLRLFGLAVIDSSGAPTSRWRHLVRNIIVVIPFVVCVVLFYLLKDVQDTSTMKILILVGGSFVALLIGLVFFVTAIIRPNGSWFDRLAGTRVVLR
jgi:uncharacterized RDD family membrane protein YckC